MDTSGKHKIIKEMRERHEKLISELEVQESELIRRVTNDPYAPVEDLEMLTEFEKKRKSVIRKLIVEYDAMVPAQFRDRP